MKKAIHMQIQQRMNKKCCQILSNPGDKRHIVIYLDFGRARKTLQVYIAAAKWL
jgi:hypothetical protein